MTKDGDFYGLQHRVVMEIRVKIQERKQFDGQGGRTDSVSMCGVSGTFHNLNKTNYSIGSYYFQIQYM